VRVSDEPTIGGPPPKRPTPEQLAVIRHRGTPARLLAGPGTGKTDTFAWRAEDLIETDGVPPEQILMLSYSRLSARELRIRLRRLRKGDIPTPKTLHSYALEQLRRNRVGSVCGERIVDDWEMKSFFRDDLASRLGTSGAKAGALLIAMQADWRMLKDVEKPLPQDRAALEDALRAFRLVFDFALLDELVYRLKTWADKQPEFKPELRHLMVDEFQDMNKCDQAVIRLLRDRSGAELLVAGDDEQSVHGWRQANPDAIRSFIADYAAVPYDLTECWRCGQNIIDHSFSVIEPMRDRDPKRVRLTSKRSDPGEVLIVAAKSAQASPRDVARLLAHLVHGERSCTTGEVLVLVPRRDFAELYVAALTKAGVRATNLVDPGSVLDAKAIRQLLYALQLVLTPTDSVSFRALLHLEGGIGPARVRPIIDRAIARRTTFIDAARTDTDKKVAAVCARVAGFPAIEPIMPARDAITSMAAYLGTSDADRDALLTIAEGITGDLTQEIEPTLLQIREFRHTEAPSGEENPDGPVRVMSFRQAKGLSAGVVIVTDIDDEIVPGGDDPDLLDEQRRLLYVSMTRAERKLYLLYCGRRARSPSAFAGTGSRRQWWEQRTPSRFLQDLAIRTKTIDELVPTIGKNTTS
jgi:DNA helicase-2/ATP-dependent DNA helicase PcrA